MALGTVNTITQTNVGGMSLLIVEVQPTAGANYTTNGEPFDVAQIPNAKGQILAVIPIGGHSVGGNSAQITWDHVNKKLKAYGTGVSASGLTEIANAVDLSAQRCRFIVLTSGV